MGGHDLPPEWGVVGRRKGEDRLVNPYSARSLAKVYGPEAGAEIAREAARYRDANKIGKLNIEIGHQLETISLVESAGYSAGFTAASIKREKAHLNRLRQEKSHLLRDERV
jgi:hypothetical protein